MAKIAALLLALVAVAAAKPMGMGGAVVSKNHHVSSSIISPMMGMGMGYGMLGYPGIGIGHSISSHSIGHMMPHYGMGMGMGMMGMKGLYGMYPGGIGMGYGLMG